MEFLQTHDLGQYVGEMIVLEGDEIIAHGRDGRVLMAEVHRRGIEVPFIHLVDLNYGEEGARLGL